MRWLTTRSVEPPAWPPATGRTRVLVENPDGAVCAAYAEILRAAGSDVVTCGGPAADGDGVRCPLLEGRTCPLVEGADVVVSTSSLPASRELLAALARRGSRVVFEAPSPAFERYRPVAPGARLLAPPVTEWELRRAVEQTAAELGRAA